MPVLILVAALPWTDAAFPYVWYATMGISMYLLIPLLINVHRELFMRPTDGANDNASGVAAMLGVLDIIVPDEEVDSMGQPSPSCASPRSLRRRMWCPMARSSRTPGSDSGAGSDGASR